MKRIFLGVAVAIGLLGSFLMLTGAARAAGRVCVWDGSTGLWSDPSHWSSCGGHAPASDDSAQINGGWAALTETVTILNLDLNGGSLALASGGPAALNVTGVFSWTAGDLQSSGLTVNLLPGSTTWLNQNNVTRLEAIVNNSGTLTLNKAGGIAALNGGGVINNYGAFNILTGTLGAPTVNNRAGGVMTINPGAGGAIQIVGQFNNAGRVDVQTGRLELSGGGTQTGAFNLAASGSLVLDGLYGYYFNPGATFAGEGWLGWGGAALEVNTPVTLTQLHMGYGSIGGYGPLTVTKNFHWDQGALRSLTLNLPPGSIGLADQDGALTSLDSSAVINNRGTFTVTHDQGISYQWTGGTFNNYGTLTLLKGNFSGQTLENKAGGTINISPTNGALVVNAAFTNAGTIHVLTGTLHLNSAFVQNSGATIVHEANIAKSHWMASVTVNGGDLRGTGIITSDVTHNGGTIAPGQSAGALTIDGSYTQHADGALDIELGSAAHYDVLHVTGSAWLGGRLNVNAINGYAPLTGTIFQVLTYGSHSGQFTAMNGLSLTQRVTLTPQFNPTDLTLITIELPKADQTITFEPLPDRAWGEPAFTITATASSGLTVTFTAGGACLVTNTLVTLTHSGRCEITARQSGDANYNAAPDVTRAFNVWRQLYLPLVLR